MPLCIHGPTYFLYNEETKFTPALLLLPLLLLTGLIADLVDSITTAEG